MEITSNCFDKVVVDLLRSAKIREVPFSNCRFVCPKFVYSAFCQQFVHQNNGQPAEQISSKQSPPVNESAVKLFGEDDDIANNPTDRANSAKSLSFPRRRMFVFFLPLLFPPAALPTISKPFRQFVDDRFGPGVADLLAREDLGDVGSYGGGEHVAGEKTESGRFFTIAADVLLPLLAICRTMECQFVQALRYFIIAVSQFTDSQVNVIAYSLGVPIVRKAMLGGVCVDRGDLGRGSLTRYVNTFLAVAGPNRGVLSCSLPLSELRTACNPINGLRCNSRFLNDINSRKHYEAQIVYVIQSTGDLTVGNLVCGVQTTAVPGADYTLTFEGLTHLQVITLTVQQQFKLISQHIAN
uniref:Triacylglycerol lipase n=1 Tax=Globodera rostochiensis TaxID=31243 RepID=A0A914HKP8_GLORO